MLDLSKKIISYVVVFSLVLSLSTVAFADDAESELTGETPVSSDSVTEADINEQLYILSKNVASLQASNSDVTYTTDDIYLLLQQMLNYNFNQQNASLMFRIYNALLQTNLNFTTLFSKIDSINSKLTNEDDTLNIYDLCGDMFEQVINHLTVSLGGNIYSITDVCILIETQIEDIIDSLANIESMLATLNNTASSINSLINTISTIATTIAANTANTIIAVNNNTTAINNLNTDLNNINWINGTVYGVSTSLEDAMNGIYLNSGQWVSRPRILYIRFLSAPNDSVYWLSSNSYVNNASRGKVPIIKFYYATGQEITYNVSYAYDGDVTYRTYVYFYNVPSNHELIISLDFSDTTGLYTGFNNQWVRYISLTSQDAYYPMYYINSLNNKRVYDKFEYLYASDDLIAAKDAQQPLEDQVLQDFTGNGSASAKLSDAASAKDASSALQSGLSTGYSASDALSVFNSFQASDYGFFAWFSPENATYFNNDSNRNLLKSNMGVNDDYTSIVWTDSVPDVITDIDNDYSRGMK